MNKKLKVKSYRQTCECCPSQWDIFTENDQYIYARYRFGRLTLELNHNETILDIVVGDNLDGYMYIYELQERTKKVLDWNYCI